MGCQALEWLLNDTHNISSKIIIILLFLKDLSLFPPSLSPSCFNLTRTDIFVFLLSTRAGGLGINLTAADTVSHLNTEKTDTDLFHQ